MTSIRIPYEIEHSELQKLLFLLSRRKSVVSLFFTGTKLKDEMKLDEHDVQALSNELKRNSSLKAFRLSSHNLPAAATAMAEALKVNNTLKLLYLDGNRIGDDEIKSFANSMKLNSSLNTLNLRDNNVGIAGAKILAETLLMNTSLEYVDLSCNKIGDSGVKFLAKSLKKNDSIKNLQLSNNGIGTAGAVALADMLKVNMRLNELNLSENQIGGAVTALCKALKQNNMLKTLKLENCGLSEKAKAKFEIFLTVEFEEPQKGVGFTLTNLELSGFMFKHTKVFTLRENGPADRAGVWIGDKIIKINNTNVTENMHFEECAELVKKGKSEGRLRIVFQKMNQRRKRVKFS